MKTERQNDLVKPDQNEPLFIVFESVVVAVLCAFSFGFGAIVMAFAMLTPLGE